MRKQHLVRLSALATSVVLSAAMCAPALAVPQTAYDQVVSERDALYQQLVDAGIEPCVQLDGTAADAGSAEGQGSLPAGEGWQVNNEWKYSDSLGWYHYYMCTVENTSDADWDVEADVVFYDAAGNIIGVAKQSEYAIAPGYEIFLSFANEDEFDHASIDIKTAPSSWYSSVQADIDVQVSDLGGKAIISATNNGGEAAKFVEYNLLFLDADGNIVSRASGYLTDGDSEIKPGATEMRDETAYADYASVVAYVHGRK